MITNNVDYSSSLNSYYYSGVSKDETSKETKQSNFDAALNNLLLDDSECTEYISKQKAEMYEKIKNGETEPSVQIGGNSFTGTQWNKLIKKVDSSIDAAKKEVEEEIQKAKEETEKESQITNTSKQKFPYSEREHDHKITYNGVTFMCDEKRNAITLGDMSIKSKVISIPLEGGGRLFVNRDNLGELSKSIGMFSPGDVKRIMVAIEQDKQCTKNLKDIDDMENEVVDGENNLDNIE